MNNTFVPTDCPECEEPHLGDCAPESGSTVTENTFACECGEIISLDLHRALDWLLSGYYLSTSRLIEQIEKTFALSPGYDARNGAVAAVEGWLGFPIEMLVLAIRHLKEEEARFADEISGGPR